MKILNLNIGNPSVERARKQLNWILNKENYDIIILTEVKRSLGCALIESELRSVGYTVYTDIEIKEYGVLFATKHKCNIMEMRDIDINLSNRMIVANIRIKNEIINIIGIYVPSNDKRKNERKKIFLESVISFLSQFNSSDKIILCGDFNTVMRNHMPKYSMFRSWEYLFFDEIDKLGLIDSYESLYKNKQVYSWFGKNGNAYKYDYIFISNNLNKNLKDAIYLRDTIENKLSDHSASMIKLDI